MSDAVLLVDVGNTRSKWLLATEAGLVGRGTAATADVPAVLGAVPPGSTALVASVAAAIADENLRERLAAAGLQVWFARPLARLDGLGNAYAEPSRLGVDRWLAMLAALQRHRGERFCVIDAGSALTIDLVDADGRHEGGYILPGRRLMERSLLAATDRVRFTAAPTGGVLPGRSTAEAVGSGIELAQAGAVRLALATARQRAPLSHLLLCGGDAALLAPFLEGAVMAPDLVFEGLLRQASLEGQQVAVRLPLT